MAQPEFKNWEKVGSYQRIDDAIQSHVDIILNEIDTTIISEAGLKVLIDANHSIAVANPVLFKRLGVKMEMMYPEPHGRFAHNPEPTQANIQEISDCLKSGDYDIGFVQDAYADRLVILDENGRFIGEDYSFAYCVDHILHLEKSNSLLM